MSALTYLLCLAVAAKSMRVEWLDKMMLVNLLYEVYRNDSFTAFQKYPLEIFSPLSGPYYRRLDQLTDAAALHMAANGFPSGQPVKSTFPIYPPLRKGQSFIYNVSF
ncbi:unnamed protein product [Mesocestoides corti]|uniref:Uncharacterized protein n=2 Tax=Mesocestoides corti TaxID=53468 RepID=A0A0R3U982_MESCO|nr:unnamed protein product [Mesocestoides corti]